MLTHPILNRRELLQIGAHSFGIGLAGLYAARAASASYGQERSKARSVILVLLTGGPSQLDTFDMKPDAPAEVRGEFRPRQTSIPGIAICEHLPRLAERMRHWAIVRSLSHGENGHLPATHRLLTGSPMPNQRSSDLDNVLSRRDWPCYAAGLSAVRPRHDGIPCGVSLPHALVEGPLTWPGQHAGFLGPAHDPLLVRQDPNSPTFRLDSFQLPADADPQRMDERRKLLDRLAAMDWGDSSFAKHQQLAFELLSSGKVAEAFRLEREPDRVRDKYGRNMFGQSLLLSRRLVGAGVPIVQANMGIVQSWDTHVDNWGRLKSKLLPWLDQGLAALIDDLDGAGRLEETLVAVLGEFGRTPRVSFLPGAALPGRDHWAAVYSGLFAGGGTRGGRVIGRSDRNATFPVTTSYTPFDVGATIYQSLGLEPEMEFRDPLNRPFRLNSGRPIQALFQDV